MFSSSLLSKDKELVLNVAHVFGDPSEAVVSSSLHSAFASSRAECSRRIALGVKAQCGCSLPARVSGFQARGKDLQRLEAAPASAASKWMKVRNTAGCQHSGS